MTRLRTSLRIRIRNGPAPSLSWDTLVSPQCRAGTTAALRRGNHGRCQEPGVAIHDPARGLFFVRDYVRNMKT